MHTQSCQMSNDITTLNIGRNLPFKHIKANMPMSQAQYLFEIKNDSIIFKGCLTFLIYQRLPSTVYTQQPPCYSDISYKFSYRQPLEILPGGILLKCLSSLL